MNRTCRAHLCQRRRRRNLEKKRIQWKIFPATREGDRKWNIKNLNIEGNSWITFVVRYVVMKVLKTFENEADFPMDNFSECKRSLNQLMQHLKKMLNPEELRDDPERYSVSFSLLTIPRRVTQLTTAPVPKMIYWLFVFHDRFCFITI